MKNLFKILSFLLISCCCAPFAQAQKAYDISNYKATIYGNPTSLQLADGYLLASKVTIRSQQGNQVFAPSAAEPDARGELRFDPVKATGRYKNNRGSWLMLKKLNATDYPAQLKAVYWDGKVQTAVVFKQP